MAGKAIILDVSPAIDFESRLLKKGERVPKGWTLNIISAADLPKGWPPRKRYKCQCGCGKAYRIGDRVAVRNVRETGGSFVNGQFMNVRFSGWTTKAKPRKK